MSSSALVWRRSRINDPAGRSSSWKQLQRWHCSVWHGRYWRRAGTRVRNAFATNAAQCFQTLFLCIVRAAKVAIVVQDRAPRKIKVLAISRGGQAKDRHEKHG